MGLPPRAFELQRFCRQSVLKMARTAALSIAVAALSWSPAAGYGCLDENGGTVGWWVILKQNNGLAYSYMDASSSSTVRPRVNGATLNSYTNSLGGTLQQIIDYRSTLGVMLWNDEVPVTSDASELVSNTSLLAAATLNLTSGTSGHTKGVIAGNNAGGFWITHSMPLFPVLTGSRFSWTPSTTYAQTFLCVSLGSAAEVDAAAAQISYVDPQFYDSSVPVSLASALPNMVSVIAGSRSTGTSVKTFSATSGTQFTHIGKSGSTGLDLMEDVVQAYYQLNFLWETWRRAPAMQTYCQPQYAYDSINVNDLQWTASDGSLYSFRYTQDHSKWGIAVNGTAQQRYICIGDMNRMTSQWTRGGGTVCFRQGNIYTPLLGSIAGADAC